MKTNRINYFLNEKIRFIVFKNILCNECMDKYS